MLGLGQVIRPGVNWRSNETRLIQVYMIEIVGISRPHSGTSSALNSNPSQQRISLIRIAKSSIRWGQFWKPMRGHGAPRKHTEARRRDSSYRCACLCRHDTTSRAARPPAEAECHLMANLQAFTASSDGCSFSPASMQIRVSSLWEGICSTNWQRPSRLLFTGFVSCSPRVLANASTSRLMHGASEPACFAHAKFHASHASPDSKSVPW